MNNGITRRAVLAGAAAAAGTIPSVARSIATGRPNILWLVSEDNNPFIGAYGDKLAHTPAIDELARRGVKFEHAYSNAPVCAPSRFAILTGIHPESCAPANQMRAVAQAAGLLHTYPELMRQAGYWCTNNAKTDYNADFDANQLWDRQGRDAHWRTRPNGQPFMAVFNYETTHESRLFKPVSGRVTPEMITPPPYLPDTAKVRADYASYHNLIERMDAQIAARLAELEADGLTDDTVVFYYSDNGGVMPRSKRYCYEEGLRCALIIAVPPKWRHLLPAAPGSTWQAPVSFVDLAPTLLSIAGAVTPPQMQGRALLGPRAIAPRLRLAFGGRNRMDERIDFVRTVTDGRWRYIRNYMPHRPTGMHGAFEWQLGSYQSLEEAHLAGRLNEVQERFFKPKPFEELYDLAADPDQTTNLAGRQRQQLRRLSSALDRHMIEIYDNGFIPEGWDQEGWVRSRDAGAYPLAQIMALAGRGASGKASVAQLRDGLRAENPIVRYWSATGLLIAGRRAVAALPDLLRTMLDQNAEIAIVAAEAAFLLGRREGLDCLGKFAASPERWQTRLAALNSLTALGMRSLPLLPVIDAAANDRQEYLRNAGRYLSAVLHGQYTPSYPVYQPAGGAISGAA